MTGTEPRPAALNPGRPYRLTYNGRQVGGRFTTVGAAKRAALVHGAGLIAYPDPRLWAIEEVYRAPQTRALLRTVVARPFC